MNLYYYVLYHTVFKNREEKQVEDNVNINDISDFV